MSNYFKSELKGIVPIVFLIFLFRSSFYEPYKIPSGSMIPTLLIGDYILVEKFAYGLHLPYSEWLGQKIMITPSVLPKRGDVVVFYYPKNPSINYIKRAIGLPGDQITIVDKVVYINGEKVPIEKIDGKDFMEDMDEKYKNAPFDFFKNQTGEANHVTALLRYDQNYANYSGTVPANHIFVMGDNRDQSSDSRVWGFVPREMIKGRARVVWFSANFPCPSFLSFICGDNDPSWVFRPWRIGRSIQ